MGESSGVVDWGDIGIYIEADDKKFVGCVVGGINSDVAHAANVVGHNVGLVVDSAGEYC